MQYPTKELYCNDDDKDMDFHEFCTLLSGIMPESPLGNIISIRSEEDKDTLKHFSDAQHQIRNEWRDRQTKKLIASTNKEEVMDEVKNLFKSWFS